MAKKTKTKAKKPAKAKAKKPVRMKKQAGKGRKPKDKFSQDWFSLKNEQWRADWDDDAGDFESESSGNEES
ncbi:TPA: hypothetical protein HA244_03820 [Candidatus Micrarchaeota archaeon]|nr:hypothetical protein [Candidatus Micrarchaeota archaeon]